MAAYIKVPDDWIQPCVWAWDDGGANAFAAWPGGEAVADSANPGWYYCYIPSWVTHVIVSASEASVQTGDLIVEAGKPVWITVTSSDEAAISYEKQTTGETPAYVEVFAIHTRVPDSWAKPNLWAWSAPDGTNAFSDWPGKAMKDGGNGWFTATAPVWINSVIVNASEGNVQTADLSIDAREVWVDITDEETVEISYDDPDKRADNVSIRVIVPDEWTEPNLWAWSHPDGANAFSAWPGEPFAENGQWYELEAPGWINRVIVNANGGTVQTADIEVESEKDMWLVVSGPDEYSLTYNEPSDVSVKSESSQVETASETPSEKITEAPTLTPTGTPDVTVAPTETGNAKPLIAVIIIAAVAAVVGAIIVVIKRKKR
jgi:hypothetical protein